ncbi:hypothetical protein ACI2I2_16075 [Scandinavium sp. NPDC088450]|uniref:hypothetical protein n=1 Tax=Scandinavium sp. NPDC088450 TaxID=3364514 RepID=UPI00384BA5E9
MQSIHTCTKYLGSRSDLIAGAVITSRESMAEFRDFSTSYSASQLSITCRLCCLICPAG